MPALHLPGQTALPAGQTASAGVEEKLSGLGVMFPKVTGTVSEDYHYGQKKPASHRPVGAPRPMVEQYEPAVHGRQSVTTVFSSLAWKVPTGHLLG